MDGRSLDILVKMLLEADEIDERIQEFDITESSWFSSRPLRDLLLMPLLQIGELTSHFKSNDYLEAFPSVPWREIKGFRNVVVHGYGHIDNAIAWNAATQGVGELRAALMGNDEVKTLYEQEKSYIQSDHEASESMLEAISALPDADEISD